ncbi:ABC transporter ATP-binding protein [Rhodovulum sp. DZ06]|uniref:ATP-binding cassette domain-containing protein n=1 Tax=Rhodovulum sp. DZ06 TaxID=3425126 RepID=UPI003D3415A2
MRDEVFTGAAPASGAAEAVLSVRGFNVRAGDKRILEGLDLDLPRGALLGLMGPMGCGKSTLIKCLAQTIPPGLELSWERLRYVAPQNDRRGRPLFIAQKVREAATDPAASHAQALARIEEIARVAGGSDAVLCIDEPTAGLAAADGALVMQALRARSAVGAVIVVSHNAAEVAAHCTHAALCAGGRILAQLPAAAFFGPGAGPEVTHFLRTGGLPLAGPGTPTGHLAPELRPSPEGFDTSPARPGAALAWILPDRFALAAGTGEGAGGRGATAGMHLLSLGPDGAALADPAGASAPMPWPEAARPADGGAAPVLALCRRIEAILAAGGRIALVPGGAPEGAAAILGGFLVLCGFGPDEAARIARRKMPGLFFGMRLEQLFWDIDLELSMDGGGG